MQKLEELIEELTSGDDQRAEPAAKNLIKFNTQAIITLKTLLQSPDADTRWWAVRTLSGIPSPQSIALLVEALSDEDLSVRQCAALALRHQPDPGAVPVLINAISSHDPLLAHLAADALAAIGEPAVVPLLEIMQNGSRKARLEAVRALGLIGDKRAIPALYAALDEDSTLLEYWANEGLERMGLGMVYFNP
jgi:HEAT repeat protein